MKGSLLNALASVGLLATGLADPVPEDLAKNPTEAEKAEALVKHQEGSEKVSIDQDKQTANAQELLLEQTNQKVIALLSEVETLMAKATDELEDGNTSGDTIAMQTEIIEKIYEAAKEKSQNPSPGEGSPSPSMEAMLEMMGQMMGKEPGENQDKESNKGGEGSTGESNSANTDNKGVAGGETDVERRVPRATGISGTTLPPEFQKALDGYNKAAKAKK